MLPTQQARQTRRPRRKTQGQSLVEFALVMPALLLLLFGVIDFGWMIFNYAQLYNSLREGLRYGTVPGPDSTSYQYRDCSGIKSRIMTLANSSGIQASNITIAYDSGDPTYRVATCETTFSFTSPSTQLQSGDRLVIALNVPVPFLSPFLRAMFPGGLSINLLASRSLYCGSPCP